MQKTEEQMRDEKVPTFHTEKELMAYIHELVNMQHDYGTCVYAMSHAAVAAFNFVASELGVTGFQASCADMDILKHTRHWNVGRILDYEKLLYPQYCNSENFPTIEDIVRNNRMWLGDEAQKLLDQNTDRMVAPEVWAHWKKLVALRDAVDGKRESDSS